ncbi:hypothetical protein NIES4072_27650 [Nostoc commune NIES-4072]|uniref:Uncharacterized protein n=1 Tax=Nostoc commune NIES-4072 TaxID=2005467 RepID=A0A2R5FNS2_NOSCO|nr:hypothetical protein NIES4070_63090 [Nostoc commune HK-02]GBG19098.1 hypothetical protein NIES4072_27650 [Nostoc commune NIES-4072]
MMREQLNFSINDQSTKLEQAQPAEIFILLKTIYQS